MADNSQVTKADLAEVRDVLLQRIGELSTLLAQVDNNLREYIDQRTYDAETRLLRGFADYNAAADIRMRKLEADMSNVDTSATQRLAELERRLTDLEIRVMRQESRQPPGPQLQ